MAGTGPGRGRLLASEPQLSQWWGAHWGLNLETGWAYWLQTQLGVVLGGPPGLALYLAGGGRLSSQP
jgi:hypothetical protein